MSIVAKPNRVRASGNNIWDILFKRRHGELAAARLNRPFFVQNRPTSQKRQSVPFRARMGQEMDLTLAHMMEESNR